MKYGYREYKIKDLAKFYGISQDAIRLYDSKGLIRPQRDEETRYRNFRRNDIIQLDYVQRLKQLKFSLEQIDKILIAYDIEEVYEELCSQQNELEKQIEETTKVVNRIRDFKEIIQRISISDFEKEDIEKSRVSVCMSPRFILKDVSTNIVTTSNEMKNLAPNSLRLLTAQVEQNVIENVLESREKGETYIDRNYERNLRENMDFVLTIEDDRRYSLREDFPANEYKILESKKCVHTILKIATNNDYSEMDNFLDYIIERNLVIDGDAIFRLLIETKSFKQSYEYFEVWLPVK